MQNIGNARIIADAHFDFASESLGLADPIRSFIKHPSRTIKVTIPLTMDDGILQFFTAYRIQHNDLHPSMMGGIIYHSKVDEAELAALAETITWRAAIVRIPVGGVMGGICCDPHLLSRYELKRITQKYVSRVRHAIGIFGDILAPVINKDSETLLWMLQEHGRQHGRQIALIADKPGFPDGFYDPRFAASRGTVIVLAKHLNDLGHSLKRIKVAIHGFDSDGARLALILARKGCEIIAVSDSRAALISNNEKGLHIPKLIKHLSETGSVSDFPGARTMDREEILSQDCCVLITTAAEGEIDEQNADKVKAAIVVEASNLPVSFAATELFERKRITVLPDILTNAGAIISSYFEWKQNPTTRFLGDEDPEAEVFGRLTKAYEDVRREAISENVSLKKAAYAIALRRITAEESKFSHA